jgi:hypothetical protein
MAGSPDSTLKPERPVAVPVPVVSLVAAPFLAVLDGKLVAVRSLKPAA